MQEQHYMTDYACWKCNQKTKVHPHRNKHNQQFPDLSLRCSVCHHDVIACKTCGTTSPDQFYGTKWAPQDQCFDCRKAGEVGQEAKCWRCNRGTHLHPRCCYHPYPWLSLRCVHCREDAIACSDCDRASPDWFYAWGGAVGAPPAVQDKCIDCWAKAEAERSRSPVPVRRGRVSARG